MCVYVFAYVTLTKKFRDRFPASGPDDLDAPSSKCVQVQGFWGGRDQTETETLSDGAADD